MGGPLFRRGGRTLVGMIHLGPLPGQAGHPGMPALVAAALEDLRALEEAGLDAALVENWRDESPSPFAGPETAAALGVVTAAVAAAARVPVGVNVLPNDYRAACALVAAAGARFLQVDVLVDPVVTDYSYSQAPPFEVHVDLADLAGWRARLAPGAPLLATVQPKHYRLLEERPLERSVEEAARAGADVVVVTGAATGSAPDVGRLRRARAVAKVPLLLGSGLDVENAGDLMPACDGAIVGTALKTPDFARVDPERARTLVQVARDARYGGEGG